MSSFSPTRLPRSLYESPAYDPAWRHLQVREYLRCRGDASEGDETFVLPLSERDSMVRAFFKFCTDAPTPKAAVCHYAQDCHETNDRNFIGSRIKAMPVAGMTTAQIAGRLHTSPENIAANQKLFFDIGAYQQDAQALGAILAPMLEQNSQTPPRERIWLVAALKLGVKGLDYVMDQRVRLSAEEQKQIAETIHSILAEQSLAYSLSLQAKPEACAEVLEAYQKSQELRLRNPTPELEARSAYFNKGILDIARKKFQARTGAAATDPAGSEARGGTVHG